jgi:methylase of polypeptide subunit release factors
LTLIVRPETEEWVHSLYSAFKSHHDDKAVSNNNNKKILEIGCGSGCISLSLDYHLVADFNIDITAIDVDHKALRLARLNQRKIFAGKYSRTRFIHGDLFDPDLNADGVDLIISNPPYVSSDEYLNLDPVVLEWESPLALSGSVPNIDGLAYYERIAQLAHNTFSARVNGAGKSSQAPSDVLIVKSSAFSLSLTRGRWPVVVVEVGEGQARDVIRMFDEYDEFTDFAILVDCFGIERVVCVFCSDFA